MLLLSKYYKRKLLQIPATMPKNMNPFEILIHYTVYMSDAVL